MRGNVADYEWLIRGVVEGDALIDAKNVGDLLERVNFYIAGKRYFCIAIKCVEEMTDVQIPIRIKKACAHISRIMERELYSYIGSRFYVIALISEENSSRGEIIKKLVRYVEKYCGFSVQVGVGKSYGEVEKLSYSRVEACEALGSIKNEAQIAFVDDIYVTRSSTTVKMANERRRVIYK